MEFRFVVESMVRGYHEYKTVWDSPILGEELICAREIGNSYDPMAVAVKKEIHGETITVGHTPKRISALCSIFIRRGGNIKCTVNGSRRYSADLPQGGLKVPRFLTFTAKSLKDADKAKELILSSLTNKVLEERERLSVSQPGVIQSDTATLNTVAETVQFSNSMQSVQLNSQQLSTGELTVEDISVPPIDSLQTSVDLTASIECSPPKKMQKCVDVEHVIMGYELSDLEINLAQQLLKQQFIHLNGFQSTLLQEKPSVLSKSDVQNKLQLIFCKERKHWIVATTINCDCSEVKVYDSLFSYVDKDLL